MSALALQQTFEIEPLGPAEKAEVVDALYKHYTMQKVCEATGYELRRIMTALDGDKEFANQVALAEKHLATLGEDELKRRAIFGVQSVVVANGRVVYQVKDGQRVPMVETKYSDTLLTKYLEANKREKYGQKVDITTTHRGSIALPVIPPELMELILAKQRGESIEFEVDDTLAADAPVTVIEDAEFEDEPERADAETIQARVREIVTPRDDFDIF